MDFSPYKPSPDEDRHSRLQQEKKRQSKGKIRGSTASTHGSSSYQSGGMDVNPSLYEEGLFSAGPSAGMARGAPGGIVRVNKYETRLPIRVDLEAALAYLLGPITGSSKEHV